MAKRNQPNGAETKKKLGDLGVLEFELGFEFGLYKSGSWFVITGIF